jgi:WD40 repeat protein
MQSLPTIFELDGNHEPVILFEKDGLLSATAVTFFPDDQKAASLDSNGKITIWNTSHGGKIAQWSHVKSREDAGDLISTRPTAPNMVMEMRNPMIWGLSSVAVSPNGNQILSGGGDTFMRLWSVDGHLLYEFPHHARVVRVGFTSDGRRALSGCWDGSAFLWQLPS